MNASTVIIRLPSSVTSQSGILAKKPTSPMASAISWGSATDAPVKPPMLPAAVATMPLHTSNIFTSKSIP